MPELLKLMEPALDPGNSLTLPVDADSLPPMENELERRRMFVTIKLPVVLDRPEAWRAGELARTLDEAVDLSLLVERLGRQAWSSARRSGNYLDNPWQWIDAGNSARTDAILLAAGAARAGTIDCARHEQALFGLPAAFRRGYTIERVRAGHTECIDFGDLQLAELARTVALEKDPATARHEAAIFSPIAKALARDGAIRTSALDAVAPFCDASTHERLRDPWRLCEGVTRREVAQAAAARAAEQARVAEADRQRREAEARRDPLECPADTVLAAAKALGYAGDAEFWGGTQSACRLRPEDRGQAIVALTYVEGDQRTGVASAPQDDPGYSLDVVIVRVTDGSLVAHTPPGGHIDSDAVRFNGIAIDTASYMLSPGLRAFGVRTAHSTSCYGCLFGTNELTLYVQRGPVLTPVLGLTIGESSGEIDATDCSDQPSRMSRTLRGATSASHGYADLWLRTSISVRMEDLPDACKKNFKASATAKQILLRFDGQSYQAIDGTALSMP
ncbi:MAG: hypothetical protein JO006_15095 [Paucibacter sp.]|nr:hypothetical protein [Roseateles sp.]